MIKTENLTKFYGHNSRGIIDLTLEIKKGEIFGFIGPNGAGKSTTVRTLLNYIFPSSGSASIMGLDVVNDSVEIRKNVGYIPSEVNYYNDMNVKDFLKYSTEYYTNDYEERLDYLTEKLEVDLNKKIGDLSFGNKKKLAIVAAFVYEPEILILDEPTSGLDPLMQQVFFELLEEERKRGATIFFSSHVLGDVQRICDRVGIIKEGKLIKIESIDDILKTRAKKIRIISDNLKIKENDNIKNLVISGNRFNFIYKGEIKELIKLINGFDIIDMSIVEPSLEEMFMHYYEREE